MNDTSKFSGTENHIYGLRPLIESIKAGKEIDRVLIQKGLKGELFPELFELIRQFQIPFQNVPIEKLNRLTRKNHQGIVAFVSSITYQPITEIVPAIYELGQVPLILILDGVTDVRNFGAIARTAECAGVHAIVIPEQGAAQINADAMKTSAGALNNIPVSRVKNLNETIDFLKNSGLQIVAATEKANTFYNAINFTVPTAIILGAEDSGVSPAYIKKSDLSVKIPILGKTESLNVSVATAVLVYEAVRQRQLSTEI
jgi:23S rRNA (guanosine2251-2'-O)-methyltransferase